MEPARHQQEHLGVDLEDRIPRRRPRAIPIGPEQLPATGTTDLLGNPVAGGERRIEALEGGEPRGREASGGRSPAGAPPRGEWPPASRRSCTLASTDDKRSRNDSMTSTAASSASVMAPTVGVVLRRPSPEVGSSDSTVMSASIIRATSLTSR